MRSTCAERGPGLRFVKCCDALLLRFHLCLQWSPKTVAPDPARQAAMAFPHLQQPSFLLVSVCCPPRAHGTGLRSRGTGELQRVLFGVMCWKARAPVRILRLESALFWCVLGFYAATEPQFSHLQEEVIEMSVPRSPWLGEGQGRRMDTCVFKSPKSLHESEVF